jgi:putative nucleotidyltransferase with HDIG domain
MVSKHKLKLNIAKALLRHAEVRDPYIKEHSLNVARIAKNIAIEMGLNKDQIFNIKIAGMLHDIGKTYIDSNILHKPGILNDLEFDMIKKHAKLGYEFLLAFKVLGRIPWIVLRHHENIDGSGYPYKLKRNDLCIESKIIRVADTYEAMTFRRPYRIELEYGAALNELKKNSGKFYDEDVVNAVFSMMGKGLLQDNNRINDVVEIKNKKKKIIIIRKKLVRGKFF